jgi:ribosomal protein L40E
MIGRLMHVLGDKLCRGLPVHGPPSHNAQRCRVCAFTDLRYLHRSPTRSRRSGHLIWFRAIWISFASNHF